MKHYHVGSNMPGYMPDAESIYTTTELRSAVDYANDELNDHYEFLFDGIYEERETAEEREALFTEMYGEEERFSIEEGDEQYINVNDATSSTDLGYSYWITACYDENCELEEED